ncbi:spherulin 4-like cell surface protein [Pseudohyphozyma bogoriensis]|nr:spherulin 4-like cell surface protein [Pseudohyphozyma bogoriensis]
MLLPLALSALVLGAQTTLAAPAADPLVARAAATSTTGIIFPLYYSPDPSTCYPEVQAVAKAHPKLPFTFIINPNSGPTTDTTDPMLACIPALRKAAPTSKIVGYVSTDYGKRASKLVQADINTYKGWSKYKEGGVAIPIDGIFLDETNTDGKGTTNFTLYSAYSRYIRQQFGANATIVLNPGDPVPAEFYPLASYLVTYESAYSEYKSNSVQSTASTPLKQQAVMVHSFPLSGTGAKAPATLLTNLVNSLAPNVGLLYVTNLQLSQTDVYGAIPPNWKQFTTALTSRDGI